MLVFGPVSSLFDFLTFFVMLDLLAADHSEFRTGWFVESLATQTLVIYVIRTRRVPFIRSRPSLLMLIVPPLVRGRRGGCPVHAACRAPRVLAAARGVLSVAPRNDRELSGPRRVRQDCVLCEHSRTRSPSRPHRAPIVSAGGSRRRAGHFTAHGASRRDPATARAPVCNAVTSSVRRVVVIGTSRGRNFRVAEDGAYETTALRTGDPRDAVPQQGVGVQPAGASRPRVGRAAPDRGHDHRAAGRALVHAVPAPDRTTCRGTSSSARCTIGMKRCTTSCSRSISPEMLPIIYTPTVGERDRTVQPGIPASAGRLSLHRLARGHRHRVSELRRRGRRHRSDHRHRRRADPRHRRLGRGRHRDLDRQARGLHGRRRASTRRESFP